MKRIYMIVLLFCLVSLLASVCLGHAHPFARETPVSPAPPKRADESAHMEAVSDAGVMVHVKDGDVITETPLFEYLCGVVAAEMPASFEPEALKAQAVAARTFTLRQMLSAPEAHLNADICTDPACCQAYADDGALREKWGDEYLQNREKIRSAVAGTDGERLEYDGEPIIAAYHSSSPGVTESAEEVWGSAVPYLISEPTPETAASVPRFDTAVTVSADDFRDTVLAAHSDAVFGAEPENWVGEVSYTDGRRVKTVLIGGVQISGTELRAMFGLRSAAFEISASDSDITFHVTGYGHGAGMSQYGANVMAESGSTYEEILAHYYPGAALVR